MGTKTSGMIVIEPVKDGTIATIHRTRNLHTVNALSRTRLIAGFALAILLTQPAARGAEAPVSLGTADAFAVLAGAGITVANAVKTTKITGDIGTFPTLSITGLENVTLTGVNHAGDAVTQNAKDDLVTAYNDAAGRTPVTSVTGDTLGGLFLTSGVYGGGALDLTGTLTLNAEGNPDAVWIFQAASTLITASGSKVTLINGAQACHVFWQVGSSATLGTDSVFVGNILAFTSITLTTGATVDGRVLARNGAVTLDNNTVAMSVCLGPPVTPVITWPQPADITYGTALGASQLNATASVPGTFAYSPPAGTVLNVGAGQTLSVIFTPTDAIHYTTATASTILNVMPRACDLSDTTLGAAVVGGNMEMYFTNRYGLSAVEGLTLINSTMTGTAPTGRVWARG